VQGANDSFIDPTRSSYNIKAINKVSPESGELVAMTVRPYMDVEDSEDSVYERISLKEGLDYASYEYNINVIYSATCEGDFVVASAGARKFAVLYKLEGDGVICQSN
jgi:hypothetical protein